MSRREGVTGTPEKPLSDLGKLSYLSYWKYKIYQYFDRLKEQENVQNPNGLTVCVADISAQTGMNVNDIASTIQWSDMFCKENDGQVFF